MNMTETFAALEVAFKKKRRNQGVNEEGLKALGDMRKAYTHGRLTEPQKDWIRTQCKWPGRNISIPEEIRKRSKKEIAMDDLLDAIESIDALYDRAGELADDLNALQEVMIDAIRRLV